MKLNIYFSFFFLLVMSCGQKNNNLEVEVYETSESGNKLTKISKFIVTENIATIKLDLKEKRQTITGFGGSFTEASASLLNRLSQKNRDTIIQAYFSEQGANYSLTRTHMNLSLIHI